MLWLEKPPAIIIPKPPRIERAMLPGIIPVFNRAVAAGVVPAITDLGTNVASGAGTTVTLTITVPAGATIVVFVADAFSGAKTNVSDTTNGAYTSITTVNHNNNSANGGGGLSYFPNSASLSGVTLTYTVPASGQTRSIAAAYITNVLAAPLDTAVTATGFGNSTSPTVTSGTPAQSGEMFVAGTTAFTSGGSNTFTQDSGHSWNSVPSSVGTTVIDIGPGSQVNAGTGTKIFSPTWGTGCVWATMVAGFKHA